MPTETRRELAEWLVRTYCAVIEGARLTPSEQALADEIDAALESRDKRAAKILETRANELQREWDAPPSAENGFIAMTADAPAGYATFWGMNNLRKLARAIRNGDTDA